MACSCKHNAEYIEKERESVETLRELFIKRMTVDSETQDRRRKDYNQAIFHYKDKEFVDYWNKDAERLGLPKKDYNATYAVWSEMDMNMVLECFDNAVKDLRRTWCDTENCTRK